LLYGQLALFLLPMIKSKSRQKLIVILAAGLVMLVGFSRIALGAHYQSDVLAAMFFGIIWLAVCAIASKPMRQRHLQLSLATAESPGADEVPLPVPVEQDRVIAANS
jgi:membrane-associated phospholipid phosphatase